MNPPIVILTDFGTADPFVGMMKGVIQQISPRSTIIDLTHEIPAGDIRHGAITLWQSTKYFAPDSIFLVVIDPGVGTSRKPIIVKTISHKFVAPDNGVLNLVCRSDFSAWEISNTKLSLQNQSTTFHGRDIFAPAAAHAARGVELSAFGDQVSDLERLELPVLASIEPNGLLGEILHQDRFGNLLTSFGKFQWTENRRLVFNPWVGESECFSTHPGEIQLELPDGRKFPFAQTFADIAPGACEVILGSSGLLEIAANRQSAAKLLNLSENKQIKLWFKRNR